MNYSEQAMYFCGKNIANSWTNIFGLSSYICWDHFSNRNKRALYWFPTVCSIHKEYQGDYPGSSYGSWVVFYGTHGPLTRYVKNWALRMRRECRERFPRYRIQRKPLVNDPGMHHDTCIRHVPWCMSGSLTNGGGENGMHSGVYATRNFTYLARGP